MDILSSESLGAVVVILAIGIFIAGGLAWTIRGGWIRHPKKKRPGKFTMFPGND